MTSVSPTSARTITYLALGDSYTIGTSVTETERWPVLLAEHLRNASRGPAQKSVETLPDIIATKGWTTADLISGIQKRTDLLPAYDLVSLLIGVNNQYDGLPIGDFENEFEQLLIRAIKLAGGTPEKVFIVSIPDYAFTPKGAGDPEITHAVLRFNSQARILAGRHGIPFLDILPISQEGLADPELVATDGLHPSGKQYRRWVEEVIGEAVREQLGG